MWFSRFFKEPSHICYVDDGGVGSGGDGDFSATEDEPAGADDSGVNDGGSDVAGQDLDDNESPIDKDAASRAIQAEKFKLKQKYEAELSKYRSVLDRMSEITGMTPEQIAAKLDEYRNQAEARQSGMDPNTYQYLSKMAYALRDINSRYTEMERRLEEKELKADPLYADWDQVRDEVVQYANERNVSYKEAYWAVHGDKRAAQLQREAEQRALAAREKAGDLGVVTGDMSGSSDGARFETQDEALAARIFNLSAKEYKALSKMKDIDDFDNFYSKK